MEQSVFLTDIQVCIGPPLGRLWSSEKVKEVWINVKQHALDTGPYMTGSYATICVSILVSHPSLQPQREFEGSLDP